MKSWVALLTALKEMGAGDNGGCFSTDLTATMPFSGLGCNPGLWSITTMPVCWTQRRSEHLPSRYTAVLLLLGRISSSARRI
jgi:hypothetical protein